MDIALYALSHMPTALHKFYINHVVYACVFHNIILSFPLKFVFPYLAWLFYCSLFFHSSFFFHSFSFILSLLFFFLFPLHRSNSENEIIILKDNQCTHKCLHMPIRCKVNRYGHHKSSW